jgi:hypothetical protein
VARFDLDGNLTWAKTLGGSGDDSFISVTAVAGGVIAVGSTDSTDGEFPPTKGESDAVVVKIS